MTALDVLRFIETKRDGGRHHPDEISAFTKRFAAGEVPEYQAAAWLMAVYFNGLDDEELKAFTLSLAHSGETLSYGGLSPLVDKPAGGVGTRSPRAGPLAAACGVQFAKLSGLAWVHRRNGGQTRSHTGVQNSPLVGGVQRAGAKGGVRHIGASVDLAPAEEFYGPGRHGHRASFPSSAAALWQKISRGCLVLRL